MSQVVSVDSVPRGLEVRDPRDPDDILGSTPFFMKAGRERAKAFEVVRQGGRGLARYRFQCGYRWTSTLLGNAPLVLIGGVTTPLGGALAYSLGVALDGITGASYQCPERYLFEPQKGLALNPFRPGSVLGTGNQGAEIPSPSLFAPVGRVGVEPESEASSRARAGGADARSPPGCKRYFVIPPYHPDEVVSRLYESKWRDSFAGRLAACDAIVDMDEARSLLIRYNVTHARAYEDVTAFSVAQTNTFGYRTNATHLVILRAVAARVDGARKDALQFQWSMYDLHSRVQTSEGRSSASGSDVIGRHFLLRALSWTFGLVPNSIGFTVGRKNVVAVDRRGDTTRIENRRDKPTLPALASNWAFHSVYHPYQYGTWALDWDFQPEGMSSYIAREMDLTLSDGSRIIDYQSDALALVGIANVLGLLHTPVGAVSLGYGIGPTYIVLADSEGYRKDTLRVVRALQLNYTAFMTENFFLRAGYIRYYGNDRVSTPQVAFRLPATTSLSLGWFVPEARSWMRSLL